MSELLEEWPTNDAETDTSSQEQDQQCARALDRRAAAQHTKTTTPTKESNEATPTSRLRSSSSLQLPKTISLKSITSAQDLTSLKKSDSFLYYSIPGVRSAKLLLKEVDTNDLGTCKITGKNKMILNNSSTNSISSPNLQKVGLGVGGGGGGAPQPQLVKRSSCISFECHPDFLLIEELAEDEGFDDYDFLGSDDDDDDDEDDMDDALGFLLSGNDDVGARASKSPVSVVAEQ